MLTPRTRLWIAAACFALAAACRLAADRLAVAAAPIECTDARAPADPVCT